MKRRFLITTLFSFCQKKNSGLYKVLKGHKQKVQDAFFSSDGKYGKSHGWDSTVKIWNAKTFSEIRTLIDIQISSGQLR